MQDLFKPDHFVDGVYRPSMGARADVIDPATLAMVGAFAETTDAEPDAALSLAIAARKSWAKIHAKTRAAILHRIANRIEVTDISRFASVMSREMAKPFPEAIGAVAECARAFR